MNLSENGPGARTPRPLQQQAERGSASETLAQGEFHSRRDFLKTLALSAGAAGVAQLLPTAIQQAMAIEPDPGSSFWDAEHVVILMQENRSFDHAFGTLQGVRGFDDPRAIRLPSGDPAWVQTNQAGKSYAPFRLDIHHTRSTWMGCLPHNWTDQVDARNEGRFDRWLDTKRSGDQTYADMPLTMGYYNREDLPFYYALADAFTVCDQNFCSSLTGTTPNRLHLWTGKIRQEQDENSHAKVLNEDADHHTEVEWRTFPELLEDEGVSWKIYQNELYLDVGLTDEEHAWLSNFGDNPIEYFRQFQVRFSEAYRRQLDRLSQSLPEAIDKLKQRLSVAEAAGPDHDRMVAQLRQLEARILRVQEERGQYTAENFAKLSERERTLHEKAFCTNTGDPHQRELETLHYQDGDVERTVKIPRGDVLHQFRTDVMSGKLPTVSWVVAPERFSDHPCSPWYGAWYLAECFNILTSNPEVWKKTIFILTYDENDGYFDHVPPFVAPDPRRPETGRVSAEIDATVEFVTREQDAKHKSPSEARESSIGLGYRVPMIIASPWSRGGCVCSQVFDHTSPIRLVETLLSRKLGRPIQETNISQWRRTVCGDLTSAFQETQDSASGAVPYAGRTEFVSGIHKAQFSQLPTGYHELTSEQLTAIRQDPLASPLRPRQEPGQRRSCPLPYELAVDGQLSDDRRQFKIRFQVGNVRFGTRSAGSPFIAYFRDHAGEWRTRNYAVTAGDQIEDLWTLDTFFESVYDVEVYGPNGFYRRFRGDANDPLMSLTIRETMEQAKPGPSAMRAIELGVASQEASHPLALDVHDQAYGQAIQRLLIPKPGDATTCVVDATASYGWYDFQLQADEHPRFLRRYAGRIESGQWSVTDPVIGSSSLNA